MDENDDREIKLQRASGDLVKEFSAKLPSLLWKPRNEERQSIRPRTQASNGSAENESDRVWSRAAESRTDFEQDNGRHEGGLDAEYSVYLTEQQLKSTVGQEVRRPIPANISC